MNATAIPSPLFRIARSAILSLSLFGVASVGIAAESSYEEGVEALREADYETAYKKWEPLVASEDGYAQFQLALMYHAGLHVAADEEKAVMLYHMAARNGVVEAQEFLVAAYENGWFGLPRNQQVAHFWQRQVYLPG